MHTDPSPLFSLCKHRHTYLACNKHYPRVVVIEGCQDPRGGVNVIQAQRCVEVLFIPHTILAVAKPTKASGEDKPGVSTIHCFACFRPFMAHSLLTSRKRFIEQQRFIRFLLLLCLIHTIIKA